MRRVLIIATVVVWILVIAEFVRRSSGPGGIKSVVPSVPTGLDLYPAPAAMPEVIATPVEDLLAEYEAFLSKDGPAVFATLQPGLSDAEIDQLEQENGFKLPGDLRALYRWHNGASRTTFLDVFPNHEFIPLDAAIANRKKLNEDLANESFAARALANVLLRHRKNWLGLILDAAGDGYYFDPDKAETDGSFFFNFAESGDYVFYPGFRNYLAAVLEGEKSGVFSVGAHGVDANDFAEAQRFMQRYGSAGGAGQ